MEKKKVKKKVSNKQAVENFLKKRSIVFYAESHMDNSCFKKSDLGTVTEYMQRELAHKLIDELIKNGVFEFSYLPSNKTFIDTYRVKARFITPLSYKR